MGVATVVLGAVALALSGTEPATEALFFTAPWCQPCRAVRPVLARLEKKFPQEFRVVVVDFDSAHEMTEQWDVHAIPVVIVISHEGRLLLRAEGADARTLESLETGVARAIECAREERRRK